MDKKPEKIYSLATNAKNVEDVLRWIHGKDVEIMTCGMPLEDRTAYGIAKFIHDNKGYMCYISARDVAFMVGMHVDLPFRVVVTTQRRLTSGSCELAAIYEVCGQTTTCIWQNNDPSVIENLVITDEPSADHDYACFGALTEAKAIDAA